MKKKATSLCLSLLLAFFWLPNLSYAQSEQNTSNPPEYTDCSSSDGNTDSGISEESGGDAPEISQAVTTEQAIDICGRISLPCNETAPKGGIRIGLTARQEQQAYVRAHATCTIPEGENSTTYTLSVAPSDEPYYILYDLSPQGLPYLDRGYFAGNTCHMASQSPSPVYANEKSIENIDIVLQKGIPIKGTISLPNKEKAPQGGVYLYIIAFSDNGTPEFKPDDLYEEISVIIAEGKRSSTYSIPVSSDSSRKFKVTCELGMGSTPVEKRGYLYAYLRDYPSNILFSIGKATNALDYVIKKGVPFHGKVYLPNGGLAPAGGTYVYIRAGNDMYWNWTRGTIPEGSNSIRYSLFADPDGIILQHFTYGGPDGMLQSKLFYSTSGNTTDRDKATLITDFSKPINIEY